MALRRKPLTAATLMIIMMKVFSGYSLICHPAEYPIGKNCCRRCPAGSRVNIDCTEFTSRSCLPCTEGTFMNEPTGRHLCFTCANCDAGSGLKINRSCTTTSDTVCEPLDGFYCINSIEDGCVAAQKHTSCQPGQYISQKGTALTDTVCTDCSSDTFSDGTLTYCQPHTQCKSPLYRTFKPGTASTDAECEIEALNTTVIVICVVLVITVIVALYWHRKKKFKTQKEKELVLMERYRDPLNEDQTSDTSPVRKVTGFTLNQPSVSHRSLTIRADSEISLQEESVQPKDTSMYQHRRPNSSGLDSAVYLHLKEKAHSFEDNNVHILDREDRWFERGVKEAIDVKLEKPSLNRGGGLRHHLSPIYNATLSSLPRRFSNLASKINSHSQKTPCDSSDCRLVHGALMGQWHHWPCDCLHRVCEYSHSSRS